VTASLRLEDVVRARTRLSVTERNRERLLGAAEVRRAALGLALDAYVALLGEPGAHELAHLVPALTVGETYFFRGAAQMEALRARILPELVAARPGRALRLLSAGCATGEEPYTLAILLREILPDVDAWDVTLVGVDVNERFLRAAQHARYGAWSLRELPAPARARWFQPEPDGAHFRLASEVSRMVRFVPHNLAVASLRQAGLDGMDLIVCQNVLFYLEPDARAGVRDALAAALAPGGVLLFGPADLAHDDVPGCDAITVGEVTAHRRRAAEAAR
jgi:chemotaxis protein methyltransferase CheR